jgi:ribosomal protein L29
MKEKTKMLNLKEKDKIISTEKKVVKDKKKTSTKDKNTDKKIIELKIELLKHTQKRKNIKKEIARLLTMKQKTKLGEQK